MPRRIRLRRTKGWRLPAGAVNVARPTAFGNPFRVSGDFPAVAAVQTFRLWLETGVCHLVDERAKLLRRLPELRGKDLACWCPEGAPCHADILLELANRE